MLIARLTAGEQIPRWVISVPAGGTKRSAAFNLMSNYLSCMVKAPATISMYLAHGRKQQDVDGTDAAAGFLWGTEAVIIGSSSNTTEGGQPVQFQIMGGSNRGQLVLTNNGGAPVQVTVDLMVW